jgi:C-terminal binding-module, SLH-like, of glucodextranase
VPGNCPCQRGKVRRSGGSGGQRESLGGLADLGCELLEAAGGVQGEEPCSGGGDDVGVAKTPRQHRYGAGSCGGATSTAAAFPQRNYTIAPADAWTQRIEVQGFASPAWVDANGNSVGTATVLSSEATKTITIVLPASAFGAPASGWSFAVVLTGQDGFSSDQARGFAPTPQPFLFGVCAPGGTSPICAVDPATVPKAMDVITPAGVDQATELDPTLGPVAVHAVPVP